MINLDFDSAQRSLVSKPVLKGSTLAIKNLIQSERGFMIIQLGIYISVAIKSGISPKQCIVVEDSYTGALAAKNAEMKAIALTDENSNNQLAAIADIVIHGFDAFDLSILN
jgi:hypothetical protein